MKDSEKKKKRENIESAKIVNFGENKETSSPDPEEIKNKEEEKNEEEKKSIVFMPEYSTISNGNRRIFKDTDELIATIDDYFKVYNGIQLLKDDAGNILKDKFGNPITHIKPPTVAGLCLKLGFMDRQSIYDYVNRQDTHSCIIKSALLTIEQFAESMLYTGKPVGAIFWLKNHKWTDQQTIDVKSSSFEKWLAENYEKPETEEAKQIN